MKIVLIPGNSPLKKDWINNVASSLEGLPKVNEVVAHHYASWDNWSANGIIDLEKEIELIQEKLPNDPYIIFGKSVGLVVAIKGINDGRFQPQKLLGAGFPRRFTEIYAPEVIEALQSLNTETAIFQHSRDPVLLAKDLAELVHGNSNISITTSPGRDHTYQDIDKLVAWVNNHL